MRRKLQNIIINLLMLVWEKIEKWVLKTHFFFHLSKTAIMISQNKRLIIILSCIPILLIIPLIAMQFSNEVNWSWGDFLIMGILLLGTGLLCEFILRKVKKNRDRIILCVGIFVLFFLVWAELAVGILGVLFKF